ncbi:unnamed protein product [Arabis nemorensis]|uniref:Uncharacterized protein n=1 Tax=Arabis nemorensis TaxID=586526 RepID=A0A565C381_9BRAS|nr:unnamed protein product [Arabis nemorensis]
MEEKKLNLDAPFLSVRRISIKPENPSEPDNTKNKKTLNTKRRRRRKVKDSCQDDRSFDHVMKPSLVPFKWEQTPGKPKDHHTLFEEPDLIKAFDIFQWSK